MSVLEIRPTGGVLRRVAGVILVAIAITGLLVYLRISGEGAFLAPRATLFTYMPDSEGMTINSPVRLSGIKIGTVRAIELSSYTDPQRAIRVEMRVQQSYLKSIPLDSETAISADTLIGDKFVAISEGKSPISIADGEVLVSEPLKQSADKADLVRAISNNLRGVNKIMGDLSSPDTPLGSIILGDAEYRQAMEKLTALSNALHQVVGGDTATGQILFTPDLYNRVRDPLLKLDQQLDVIAASKMFSDAQQYDELLGQLQQLRTSIAATQVDRDSAAYRRVQQLLKQADASISSLQLGRIHTYEELTGRLRELEALLRDIREQPKKFLRYKVF